MATIMRTTLTVAFAWLAVSPVNADTPGGPLQVTVVDAMGIGVGAAVSYGCYRPLHLTG